MTWDEFSRTLPGTLLDLTHWAFAPAIAASAAGRRNPGTAAMTLYMYYYHLLLIACCLWLQIIRHKLPSASSSPPTL